MRCAQFAFMLAIANCAYVPMTTTRSAGVTSPLAFEQDAQGLDKEATIQEREANDYLKEAQRLRKHADDLRALAQRFVEDAGRTTNPTLKKQDLDDAEDYKAQAYWVDEDAKKLEQRAADKMEKAKQLREQAAKLKDSAEPAKDEKAKADKKTDREEYSRTEKAPPEPLAFEDIAGEWSWAPQSGDDHRNDVITIKFRDKKKTTLVLEGSYTDWVQEGAYSNGKLTFVRKVGDQEMNPESPDWARELVAKQGSLKWRLVLNPVDRCGQPEMKGEFYPGEISWREERDGETGGVLKREASATGDPGKPTSLNYSKGSSSLPDMKMEEGEPDIAVHAEDADMAEYRIDSIFKTQPFLVVVTLPRGAAERAGSSLKVRFTTSLTGKSTSFILIAESGWKDAHGPVKYSTWAGIFIADDGMVQGHTRLPFIGPINEGWRRVELSNLANGEQVTVSYGKAAAKFAIYNSWVQEAIARHEEGFKALEAIYRALLSAPDLPANARDKTKMKLDMIANARRLITHRGGQTEKFTDYNRYEIGAVYHRLLLEDSSNWDLRKNSEPDGYGVSYLSTDERSQVYLAIAQAEQSYDDMFVHVIKGMSLTMYQLAVQSTPFLERSMIAVFHADSMGQPVNVTGLVMNAVGLVGEYAVLRLQVYLKTPGSRLPRPRRGYPETGRVSEPTKSSSQGGETRSGGDRAGGMREMNFSEAQAVYGRSAEFVPYGSDEKVALQVDDYSCAVEVARQMARSAAIQVPPEGLLLQELSARYDSNLEPMFSTGEGTTSEGFEYTIKKLQGYVATRQASLGQIKALLDAGFMVKAGLLTNRGTRHAIHIREISKSPDGKRFVVFDDPWTGKRTKLPSCDFELLRPNKFVSAVDFGQVPKRP